MPDSLQPHGLHHTKLPCPLLSPRVCSNSCPLSQWCHPTISSSVTLFSFSPQSFLASGSFPVTRLFVSGSQSTGGFSFSISPSSEYSGLISFRMDWLDLLEVQGTLKSFLQHHSSKASVPGHSVFLMAQLSLSRPYMTTGKTIVLIIWTFVSNVMSLLFNTLSRFVTAFLPRNEHLSWLQSLSAVTLEPKKRKSATASTFSPSVCHEMMELDAMILVF